MYVIPSALSKASNTKAIEGLASGIFVKSSKSGRVSESPVNVLTKMPFSKSGFLELSK